MVKVVIGANFGDEGKGLMTDYFASRMGGNGVVVLSNGGPQRGHTVVNNGRRYVFHHFGSGTFNDYETYCPRQFIVNPVVFCKEKYELIYRFGISPDLSMHPDCMITTPWDMMANQIFEISRTDRHGSCGMGIWETIKRDKVIPLRYKDEITKKFIQDIRDYYRKRFEEEGITESAYHDLFFGSDDLIYRFMIDFDYMFEDVIISREDIIGDYDNIIFENGQGLLLDGDNEEYRPHTTPSKTGLHNPATILKEIDLRSKQDIEVCYVTRSYLTRHGAGKMPSEVNKESICWKIGADKTNTTNEWQGSLRYGFIDTDSLLKRVKFDFDKYAPKGAKLSIAITHLNEYWPEWAYEIGDYFSDSETTVKKRGDK